MNTKGDLSKNMMLATKLITCLEQRGLSNEVMGKLSETSLNHSENYGDDPFFKMIEAGAKALGEEVFFSLFFGEPLKTITMIVPKNYISANCFEEFRKSFDEGVLRAQNIDNDFYDKTFCIPTHKLKPGGIYEITLFPIKDAVPYRTIVEFTKFQNGLLVGSQGLISMLSHIPKDSFPESFWTKGVDENPGSILSTMRRQDGYIHFRITTRQETFWDIHIVPIFKLILPGVSSD